MSLMVRSVRFDCSEDVALMVVRIVESAAREQNKNVPITCCVLLAPAGSNGGDGSSFSVIWILPHCGTLCRCGASCAFVGLGCRNLCSAASTCPGMDMDGSAVLFLQSQSIVVPQCLVPSQSFSIVQ